MIKDTHSQKSKPWFIVYSCINVSYSTSSKPQYYSWILGKKETSSQANSWMSLIQQGEHQEKVRKNSTKADDFLVTHLLLREKNRDVQYEWYPSLLYTPLLHTKISLSKCWMRCTDRTTPDCSSLINPQIQLCTCSLTMLLFTTFQKQHLAEVLSNFQCEAIWTM